MIQELIITSRDNNGMDHIAPMGVTMHQQQIVISPFRPSRTLDNIISGGCAVANYCDDVRVFAGCLTGRHDWPMTEAVQVNAPRLTDALAHSELVLQRVEDDPVRPRIFCSPVTTITHRPFPGFNRAQAAVLELAILISRLERLSPEKISREIAYLNIAVEKTAGERELQAWNWLLEKLHDYRHTTIEKETL